MAGTNGSEPRKSVKGLGSLEAQLMEALWSSPKPLSVQEVCDRLGADHNYKTVMTVLNRLVDKELLERELDGRAYQYRARQTREQFLEAIADELVQGYVMAYGPGAVRHISAALQTTAPSTPSTANEPLSSTFSTAPPPMNANHVSTNGYEQPLKVSPLVLLMAIAIMLQMVLLLRRR